MPSPDRGVVNRVTVDVVTQMFPGARRANIEAHLPAVLDSLVEAGLADRPMVLMALATIRAETAGFVPLSEFQSRFNTSPDGHPFDLYDDRSALGNQALAAGDFKTARKAVNGGTHGLEAFQECYQTGDRLLA